MLSSMHGGCALCSLREAMASRLDPTYTVAHVVMCEVHTYISKWHGILQKYINERYVPTLPMVVQQCGAILDLPLANHSYSSVYTSLNYKDGRLASATAWGTATGQLSARDWARLDAGVPRDYVLPTHIHIHIYVHMYLHT
jgi:hypothetical protein